MKINTAAHPLTAPPCVARNPTSSKPIDRFVPGDPPVHIVAPASARKFDTFKACLWGVSAALAATGAAAAFHGCPLLALGALGAASVVGCVNTMLPGPEVQLQEGLTVFPGEPDVARKAYGRAVVTDRGNYASRGIERKFGAAGAGAEFIESLYYGSRNATYENFCALAVLTEGLPAAGGEPAVLYLRGTQQLRQLEFCETGLKTPDGIELPYKSIRAAVGWGFPAEAVG